MLKIIAVIIELFAAVWVMSCLSPLVHELGHAVGYMLAAGNGR